MLPLVRRIHFLVCGLPGVLTLWRATYYSHQRLVCIDLRLIHYRHERGMCCLHSLPLRLVTHARHFDAARERYDRCLWREARRGRSVQRSFHPTFDIPSRLLID